MMSHSSNFVACIKDQDRKVLREIAGKVYLPFHSEYSILLKNNNSVNSCVSVSIDGTDVLGSHELIVRAGASIDLERFLVDGQLQQGNRFKFVPLHDSQVQDPSSPENGIIEVKFWKELQQYMITPDDYWKKFNRPTTSDIMYTYTNSASQCLSKSTTQCCATDVHRSGFCSSATPGATVAGTTSFQSFTTSSFSGKAGAPTVIRLQLMGRSEPVTVQKTKHIYCGQCGKSNPYSNKFCGRCGTQLTKTI